MARKLLFFKILKQFLKLHIFRDYQILTNFMPVFY